jgi:hypothetical protein
MLGAKVLFATPYSLLADRLYAAGLSRQMPVELHANRRVLVSLTSRGALRVHLGYEAAPDEVITAISRWARPRVRRAERLEAQRVLASFPVHAHAPPAPLERRAAVAQPGDDRIFARLRELHEHFNRTHFENTLGRVRLALSAKMRQRLGEFRLAATGVHEIVIGRRHLKRDGWKGVSETLLHEMVHQWQAESGRRLGHGREFKRMWIQVSGGTTVSVVD